MHQKSIFLVREWSLSMTGVGAEDIWMGVETK